MPTRKNFPSRVKKRQEGARERAERYAKLSLDEKIAEQLPFTVKSQRIGKQLRKLTALKEKQN